MAPKATKQRLLRVFFDPRWIGVRLLLLLVLLVTDTSGSNSSTIVTTLPGYSGELPFSLETGYIGVGDNETVQLFYYFVESQRSASRDPLVFWITGGPGCSSLAGFFFESGPLTFTLGDYNGSLPTLEDNQWAWTQGLNIIYMDGPVGTGFSYSESLDGYIMDDYKFTAQAYEFLQKSSNSKLLCSGWKSTQFLKNQLYVGGDSYSGIPIPMIVQQIVLGNEAGSVPMINLKGYVLGNPVTDSFTDMNARVPYAQRLALISDQLYQSAKTSCDGNFVNVDASNYECTSDIDAISELTNDINLVHILEPYCSNAMPEPTEDVESVRRYLSEKSSPAFWCRSYNHMRCYIWANNKGVQEALGVREGTKTFWQYCNTTLAYTKSVTNVVGYHRNLTNADLRLLIYSGDHDMSIPHIGTQQWISSLGLTTDESWRVWSTGGQTAGYTKKLINDYFTLTFVTVKARTIITQFLDLNIVFRVEA
ncbi:Serine carboxypeptidase-like 18 [Morella rubra]|uniref:Serine carboxypeptidase-like 18 n=1 Tax=Morella rubra TaxID=262757 RepID=A0A6A1VH90_9ROSI|nr:Serine carboxypeptidase-like 18 [Morella rubra]